MSKAKSSASDKRKIGKHSVSNRWSNATINISKMIGLGLAAAPKSSFASSLRGVRGRGLQIQRYGRDINALAKGKTMGRINNRLKGRIGGLVVNAALPNTNNIILRLARAQIGKFLNKQIHKKTRDVNVLEVLGVKATKKAHANIFNETGGSIFTMMQNQLAFTLRGLAPRDEFVMNMGGTVVQFSPSNLSESVMIHPAQKNPEPNVVGKWKVSVGGTNPDGPADKAPYVWIANYGGKLWDPANPTKAKAYPPTFFAERSLEFIERTYRPTIKKMYEVFTPQSVKDELAKQNKKLDPGKFITRSYTETQKKLQAIWLKKDEVALKKQAELAAKGRGKKISTIRSTDTGDQDYQAYYRKYFGNTDMGPDGKMYAGAVDEAADAAMKIMYGDETYERVTTELKRTRNKKTGKWNKRRTRVEVTESVPYAITSGTGRVRVYADMREIKNQGGQWTAGRGANSHYKNTTIDPAKVSIQKDYRFDLGEVIMTEEVQKKLAQLERNKVIKRVRNPDTGGVEIEVLDVDRFVKELEIETVAPGYLGDTNTAARGVDASEIMDETLKASGRGGGGVGTTVKGSGERGRTVLATPAEEQIQVQAELNAVKEIVDEINKKLPYTYENKKVSVGGKRVSSGKTNREHLHTLTTAKEKRNFRSGLKASGQSLNDPHMPFVEKTSKVVKTRKGFFEVKIDPVTGRATVVSKTTHKIGKQRNKIQNLEKDLDKKKSQLLTETEKIERDLEVSPRDLKMEKKNVVKEWRKRGYYAPTDPDVDQVFWKVGKHRAKTDMYVEGFGPVKKGEKVPLIKQDSMKISDFSGEQLEKTKASAVSTVKLNNLKKEAKRIESDLTLAKKQLNLLLKEEQKEQRIFGFNEGGFVTISGRRFGTGKGVKAQQAGIKAIEKYNKNKTPSVFKGVNVSGRSGVIWSRGGVIEKDIVNTDAYRAIAAADDRGEELPTLSFFFRTDVSKAKAQELGLFAYTAKVQKPKLGGGHANRGRTIKPIVEKRSDGVVDLIYKDPQLPSAKLAIRQRFSKQGNKTVVRYEDEKGSVLKPVTRRTTTEDIQNESLLEDIAFLSQGANNRKIETPRMRATSGFKTDYANDGSVVIRFEDR